MGSCLRTVGLFETMGGGEDQGRKGAECGHAGIDKPSEDIKKIVLNNKCKPESLVGFHSQSEGGSDQQNWKPAWTMPLSLQKGSRSEADLSSARRVPRTHASQSSLPWERWDGVCEMLITMRWRNFSKISLRSSKGLVHFKRSAPIRTHKYWQRDNVQHRRCWCGDVDKKARILAVGWVLRFFMNSLCTNPCYFDYEFPDFSLPLWCEFNC